ncbi:MAG: pyridoxal-dependent decarboxylase, exosortase A system-associated [Candidatus Margulisbacteria bacterium]|nr:pyridoxal-dependent decarboxylase, exosortase A system-associated [Candidatus Margulisiibacteriota bacterium]
MSKYLRDIKTPCYIYDLAEISRRLAYLKKHLPDSIALYYAVKANSNLHILQALRGSVDGLDLSSGGELEQALAAGYLPQNFSFAGPGKTTAELELAIKSACGSISAESPDDLRRIETVARTLGPQAFVSLRINPATLNEHFALKMGGKATQFGFDEENLKTLPKLKNTAISGLHIYAGTQCLNASGLQENFQNIFSLAQKLSKKLKFQLQKVNIGGGFGIDYFRGQQPLDIAAVCKALSRAAAGFGQNQPRTKIILELGRWLLAPAGYYLCSVLNIKKSRGKTFVIVDGGMHQNQAATGQLGQIIRKNYKITNLTRPRSKKLKVELAGCLCTPLDMLATGLEIAGPRVGDILCVPNSGAYGYTASPLFFLGHPTPPEYLIQDGQVKLIRPSRRLIEFN